MGRSDRLYALVEELRSRAPRLVGRNELAERLEVSARTVERDILTLQQAGVPIWTQRGRFGGYAIEQSTTLPPLNLEATEALAVMAALSVQPGLPFAGAGRRAQQKLLAAMRQADAAKAHEVAARIRTAPPRGPMADPEVLGNIERAVVGRRVVDLAYADRHGQATTRTVEAHGLHLTARSGYLIGWCRLRDAGRSFRLDRIEKAIIHEEVAPERDVEPLMQWVAESTALDVAADRLPRDLAAAAAAGATGRRTPWWELDDGEDGGVAVDVDAADLRRVRDVVLNLPGVEQGLHHRQPAFAVGAEIFAVVQPGRRIWVLASTDEASALAKAMPDVFERHYGLRIAADRIDSGELRRLLVAAFGRAGAAAAERRAHRPHRPALVWADVVGLTATMDDVAEGVGPDGEPLLRRPNGRLMARRSPDGATAVLRTTQREGDALVLADPVAFASPGTAGHDEDARVSVDLEAVGVERLRPLLVRAWELAGDAPC